MSIAAMSAEEEAYLVLFMSVFWGIFSGACVVACVHERERTASWASSWRLAAYCFGRLL
ncbi:MAG TPA: hypothetical protein VF068_00040 [Rubrobacter sp.]